MDDFTSSTLYESRNEWTARLVSILTPLVIEGYNSIFDEAWKLCRENDEPEKYLMTFQNLIARVPKWNNTIVEKEMSRIIERSGCSYLEDLVTCVHIIQLKILTCMRVGKNQKKIDISIPKLNEFIHKTYIHMARKLYSSVYLFESGIPPLQKQKNGRELETIAQESILASVRETMPLENILRAYLEEDVDNEVKEQVVDVPIEDTEETKEDNITGETEKLANEKTETPQDSLASDKALDSQNEEITKLENELKTQIRFDDVDKTLDGNNTEILVDAPKTIERLEELSNLRKEAEENSMGDDRISIMDGSMPMNGLDIEDLTPKSNSSTIIEETNPILDDIVVLN
jgi:hypothetical protein|tara:strand:+ start:238 stop:1272 length:1035 start_codon:yes stop_codon:yes gene_type:complete